MGDSFWDFIDSHIRFPNAGILDGGKVVNPLLCDHCEQEVTIRLEHEYCHLNLPKPKTYEDYRVEAVITNASIVARYSAPDYAKPPAQYRKEFFSTGTDAIFNTFAKRRRNVKRQG